MPSAERAAALRALVIGAGGGGVAALVGLPLAWMLGAIAACAGFALCGARLFVPPGLRRMVLAVIGLYLGAAFSPELFAGLHRAPATMAVLFLFSVGLAALLAFGFRRFLPTDALTAYCAGAPGALALMVVLAREKGGDERITALAQIVRVVAVVVVIPLWVRAAADAPPFSPPEQAAAMSFGALAVALAVLAIGAFAGALTKSAPVYLLVPMALSGALHAADLIDLILPRAPLNAALVVLGASIGARFGIGASPPTESKRESDSIASRRDDGERSEVNPAGSSGDDSGGEIDLTEDSGAEGAAQSNQPPRNAAYRRPDNPADKADANGDATASPGRMMLAAVIAAIVAVAAAAATAFAAAAWLDESFWKMLLILAPGGIAEMCLIAVVLDIDPPVVALHQAARVAALLALSPLIAARLGRRKER